MNSSRFYLIIIIDNCEIVSPPIEMEENKLPWNNGKILSSLNSRD